MKNRRASSWDILALLVWALVFAAGLVPDLAFTAIRLLANVSAPSAIVNSSFAITFAISGYLALFVLQRCRDAGASENEARAKALVGGLMALAAFIELPNRGISPFEPRTFLEVWLNFRQIDDTYLKTVVLIIGIGKLFCWWYLFALLLRYYAFGNHRVFRALPPIGPSAAQPRHVPAPTANQTAPEPERTATGVGE